MANAVIFQYLSKGLQATQSLGTLDKTDPYAFITDASNLWFITHQKVFPFMRITDVYDAADGKTPDSCIAISQKAANDIYNFIQLMDTSINDISARVALLASSGSSEKNGVIDSFDDIKDFLAGIDDHSNITDLFAYKLISENGEDYNVLYENSYIVLPKNTPMQIFTNDPKTAKVKDQSGHQSSSSVTVYELVLSEGQSYTGEYLATDTGGNLIAENVNGNSITYKNGTVTGPDIIYVATSGTHTIYTQEQKLYGLVYANQIEDVTNYINAIKDKNDVSIADLSTKIDLLYNQYHQSDESVTNSSINTLEQNFKTFNSSVDTSINNVNSSIYIINSSVNKIDSSVLAAYNYINITNSSINKIDASVLDNYNNIQTIKDNVDSLHDLIYDTSNDLYNIVKTDEKVTAHALIDLRNQIQDVSTQLNNIDFDNIGGGADDVYHPNSAIPATFKSKELGYLASTESQNLNNLTFSQLFDKILFQDTPASISYNSGNNSITAKNSVELGSTISTDNFNINKASVSCKYVNNGTASYSWDSTEATLLKTVADTYGTVSEAIEASFSFTPPAGIVLTTAMGAPTDTLLVAQSAITKKGSINTFVYAYYIVGKSDSENSVTLTNDIQTTFSGMTISTSNVSKFAATTTTDTTGSITTNYNKIYNDDTSKYMICGQWTKTDTIVTKSSFIYIILPSILKIDKIYKRNGATGKADEMTETFGKFTQADYILAGYGEHTGDISLSGLSTLNKYNIWYVAKASLNGDSTVTPNDSPIKIKLAIA